LEPLALSTLAPPPRTHTSARTLTTTITTTWHEHESALAVREDLGIREVVARDRVR